MILKKLTIKEFGGIEHFDVPFHEQVTDITVPNTESIVKAIGLATNNKSLIDCSEAFAVSDNTEVMYPIWNITHGILNIEETTKVRYVL